MWAKFFILTITVTIVCGQNEGGLDAQIDDILGSGPKSSVDDPPKVLFFNFFKNIIKYLYCFTVFH